MIRFLHRLGILRNARAKRWDAVKHLDANSADRRAVVRQNRDELRAVLREGMTQ